MSNLDALAAEYEAHVAEPGRPLPYVRLQEFLSEQGIEAVDTHRRIRARSWLVRLKNGAVVQIVDREPTATARQRLETAQKFGAPGLYLGCAPCPACEGHGHFGVLTASGEHRGNIDGLIKEAGAFEKPGAAQFYYVEKERIFGPPGWLVQMVADAARVDGDAFTPVEYVAVVLVIDGDPDAEAALRRAHARLSARVATGGNEDPDAGICPGCNGTGIAR